MARFETTTPPLRVSITGIDGAGKDTVARQSLHELSAEQNNTMIKLGRPSYVFENGQQSQIFRRTISLIDNLHERTDAIGVSNLILAVNALGVVVQSRGIEQAAARYRPDVIASSRDPRLDPIVYFNYYGGRGADKISYPTRGEVMQRVTGIDRDLIVLLKISPENAMKRIRERFEDAFDPSAVYDRKRWQHVHENPRELARLAEGYEAALEQVDYLADTPVVRVDTNDLSMREVVDAVKLAIERVRPVKSA